MRKFISLVVLIYFFQSLNAQIVSDINFIGGIVFYQYLPDASATRYGGTRRGKGSYNYNASLSVGAGVAVSPFKRLLRFEYNLIYYNDRTEINTVYVEDGRWSVRDRTFQNQFLANIHNKGEHINLRIGFCFDVVAGTKVTYSEGNQYGDRYIQVGEGYLKRYHQVSALIGFALGDERFKIAFDFIPALNPKVYSGEFERTSYPDFFWGHPEVWFSRSMGSFSFIYSIPSVTNKR